MWKDEEAFSHFSRHVTFIIDGAQDRSHAGLALFPELLKSEFHSIRRTIESYSTAGTLEYAEYATACGLQFPIGNGRVVTLRVTTSSGEADYKLDRWD